MSSADPDDSTKAIAWSAAKIRRPEASVEKGDRKRRSLFSPSARHVGGGGDDDDGGDDGDDDAILTPAHKFAPSPLATETPSPRRRAATPEQGLILQDSHFGRKTLRVHLRHKILGPISPTFTQFNYEHRIILDFKVF
jgi:hypothetical protein